jgi:hypothetical protein
MIAVEGVFTGWDFVGCIFRSKALGDARRRYRGGSHWCIIWRCLCRVGVIILGRFFLCLVAKISLYNLFVAGKRAHNPSSLQVGGGRAILSEDICLLRLSMRGSLSFISLTKSSKSQPESKRSMIRQCGEGRNLNVVGIVARLSRMTRKSFTLQFGYDWFVQRCIR